MNVGIFFVTVYISFGYEIQDFALKPPKVDIIDYKHTRDFAFNVIFSKIILPFFFASTERRYITKNVAECIGKKLRVLTKIIRKTI